LFTAPRILITAGLVFLLGTVPAWAWTNAAPNEAIFFDLPDFQGPSLTVRLEPGRRQALKPALGAMDKKISSLIMGEKVKALVFTNPDFRGAIRIYDYTISEHMPDDDEISSIIVCSKEEPPQGVMFIQKRIGEMKTSSERPWHYVTGKGIFFPLPESLQEHEARFPAVAEDWQKVRYVYVSPAAEADLFKGSDFKGDVLSLPGPGGGQQSVFDLSRFGFYDPKKSPAGIVSSLIVRTKK
jgi:hypothetical protein